MLETAKRAIKIEEAGGALEEAASTSRSRE
jgi:hypothetical protein